MRKLLSTGWGRLSVLAWAAWVVGVYAIVDRNWWRDETYVKFFGLGFGLPVLALLGGWWVRRGFLSARSSRESGASARTHADSLITSGMGENAAVVGQDADRKTLANLITATGIRKSISDGPTTSVDCLLCFQHFSFASGSLELLERSDHKGFLCRSCAHKLNEARLHFGLEPFEILPNAYSSDGARES